MKKIWYGIGSVLVVLAIGWFAFSTMSSSTSESNTTEDVEKIEETNREESETASKVSDEEVNEELKTEESETKDSLSATRNALENLYRENIPSIGGGDAYGEEASLELLEELLKYAAAGKYGEIIEYQDGLTESYEFSEGTELDVAAVFQDASSVGEAFQTREVGDFVDAVLGSYHPEMLMYSTLYTPVRERRYIVQDSESISPVNIFSGIRTEERRVIIDSVDAVKEASFYQRNIAEEIFRLHEDTNRIYAYDITLLELDTIDYPGTVYIREDLYGKLFFYGFYIPDEVEHYEQPVSFWISMDPLYENAEKAVEEYTPPEGEKITNEDIERLFESGW